MCPQQEFEILIKNSEISIEMILNQDYVAEDLKESIRSSNLLFIPKIIQDKPYFEIESLDLFNHFKKLGSEVLKTEICVADKDFQYRREEAVKDYVVLGWFFVKYAVLKPFIKRVKEYSMRKFKINTPIELKVLVKKTKKIKIVDLEYKGLPDHIDRILDKLEDFWNE